MVHPRHQSSSTHHSHSNAGSGSNNGNHGTLVAGGNQEQSGDGDHHASTATTGDHLPSGTTSTRGSSLPAGWLSYKTEQHQHKRRKYFRVDVPPTPEPMFKAIAKRIHQEKNSVLVQQEQKLRQLRSKMADQKIKVGQARERVLQLEDAKNAGIRDIRELRQDEMTNALRELEERLTKEKEAKLELLKAEWKKEIHEKSMEESKVRAADRAKRELESEPPAYADTNVDESGNDPPAEKLSVTKQREVENLKSKLETLNQNRTEMIWLLKQIIKAEERQKAKVAAKPKARIASSKQA